ncbi:MAG: Rpn family recombination-promoting nuclease/putative transposase [Firmicutes bacterium]|nr:Rpn family recombination-promoting nuclease/putative transposase [Bacillota bacterium]
MKKRLKAKNDFIFQRIFGRQENKDILLSLLNAILNFKDDNRLRDREEGIKEVAANILSDNMNY